MTEHDEHDERDERDEELLEAQEGTGYGEDEGEREQALEAEDPPAEDPPAESS